MSRMRLLLLELVEPRFCSKASSAKHFVASGMRGKDRKHLLIVSRIKEIYECWIYSFLDDGTNIGQTW